MSSTLTAGKPRALGRRPWFGADALVSGANGLVYLAAAGGLTELLGGTTNTYRWLGAFLVLYAAAVAGYAWSRLPVRAGWLIVIGNEIWVVASLVVAAVGSLQLDGAGRVWVVLQAGVVGLLALMQARSLRRSP